MASLATGSVRVRTTAAAAVVVALTLAAAAWVLVATLEEALGRSQDDAARSRARDLVALAAAGPVRASLPSIGDDAFIQLVDDSGVVRSSTPNVAGRPPEATFRAPGGEPVVRTVRDVRDDDERDLEDYRVWALRGESPSGPVTAYVATSLELVSEAVSTLRGLLVAGVPLVVLLFAAVTWVVLGQALRPVESIRAEVAGISDARLSRRVPVPRGDDEIGRLARTMNEMLDRLAAASSRARAFAADASHELQSPLTTFRTQLEVALSRPGAADWPTVANELLAESGEMERMVRDLLFLAGEDEKPPDEHPGALVDLDDVVLEEASRVRPGTSVRIDTAAVSGAPVRGHRQQLVRLVRNLLENAERHAATRVEVSLSAEDGAVVLVVKDDGPGVPAGDRERIFDRFVRLDGARSRDDGRSGLGLSIVDAIARRHGGTIRVSDGAGGATFVLRLPSPVNLS